MLKTFILENYLFFKAFHIISIISWMAGLLYLPRIFVYHTKVKYKSESDKLFKIMEKKIVEINYVTSINFKPINWHNINLYNRNER